MRLSVEVHPDRVTYTLRDGADATLTFRHAGEEVTVAVGEPVTRELTARKPLLPRPEQPPGRAPLRRDGEAGTTPGT
jgi:alpha,alpha-trehalose phosphorylase